MNLLHFMIVIGILKKQYKIIDACSPIPPATLTSTSTTTQAPCFFQSMLDNVAAFRVNSQICDTANCFVVACTCMLADGVAENINANQCLDQTTICVVVNGVNTPIFTDVGDNPLMCANGVLSITAGGAQTTIDPNSIISCGNNLGECA